MTDKKTVAVPAVSAAPADVWAARKRNNLRLAWTFAGVALALFLVAIWKLRPA